MKTSISVAGVTRRYCGQLALEMSALTVEGGQRHES